MTTNGFNKYLDEQNEKYKQGTSGFNNYLNAHIERNSNAEDETVSETNVPVIEDDEDL